MDQTSLDLIIGECQMHFLPCSSPSLPNDITFVTQQFELSSAKQSKIPSET